MKKLGIVQSRGLGDIVIALPIAHYYYKQDWEIHWPICSEFIPNFEHHVPWVHWHPVTTDQGSFFLEQPLQIFEKAVKPDEILTLYQALTGQDFHQELYFQHTKFDQYKYIRAGVPFINKWQLDECISRNRQREQELYDRVITNPDYAVIHLEGSDHRAKFDYDTVPKAWQTVEIKPLTTSIFDWLTVLERAQSLVLVDSVYANLVDQLKLTNDKYFIPRSHIGLTPVLGMDWRWVKF